MSPILRVVFDTSTLVSAALRGGSTPERALFKALCACIVCGSIQSMQELEEVLKRDKFDAYLGWDSRLKFLAVIRKHVRLFPVEDSDTAAVGGVCRDARTISFSHWRSLVRLTS